MIISKAVLIKLFLLFQNVKKFKALNPFHSHLISTLLLTSSLRFFLKDKNRLLCFTIFKIINERLTKKKNFVEHKSIIDIKINCVVI